MSSISSSRLLTTALLADAAMSGGCALVLLLGAGTFEGLLGIPEALSRLVGFGLLPFCALLVYLARRDGLPSWAVWAVIGGNALWAIDSVLLLMSGWIEPTWLGQAFILAQAFVVALFAELQYLGLRRRAASA